MSAEPQLVPSMMRVVPGCNLCNCQRNPSRCAARLKMQEANYGSTQVQFQLAVAQQVEERRFLAPHIGQEIEQPFPQRIVTKVDITQINVPQINLAQKFLAEFRWTQERAQVGEQQPGPTFRFLRTSLRAQGPEKGRRRDARV